MKAVKVTIAKKGKALARFRTFDWDLVRDEYLALGFMDMIVLKPKDFGCTAYALRDMAKAAIDRLRYFYDEIPAPTTHLDRKGNVLVMRSIRIDVKPQKGEYKVATKRRAKIAPTARRSKRRTRRYEIQH